MSERQIQANQIRALLKTQFDEVRPIVGPALPKHISFDQAVAQVELMVMKNPKQLSICHPVSILWAVVSAAELGLSLAGASAEAHIMPFKVRGTMVGQLVIGYRGYLKLAYQHPRVLAIRSGVVAEHDVFRYDLGANPRLRWQPNLGTRGEVIAAFCVVDLAHPSSQHIGKVINLISRQKIDEHRAAGQNSDGASSPWVKHFEQMAQKTVLKDTLNRMIPKSVEIAKAIEAEDRFEMGELRPGEGSVTEEPTTRSQRLKQTLEAKRVVLTDVSETAAAVAVEPPAPDFPTD
jgi:recombination protein RecT